MFSQFITPAPQLIQIRLLLRSPRITVQKASLFEHKFQLISTVAELRNVEIQHFLTQRFSTNFNNIQKYIQSTNHNSKSSNPSDLILQLLFPTNQYNREHLSCAPFLSFDECVLME